MTTAYVRSDSDETQPEAGSEMVLANGPVGDWELVRATQAGDPEAFGQLYDRHHVAVFGYVLCRARDNHLAEDLTVETFLRARQHIHSISYRGRDITAWLITIARNLVLDHYKSSRSRLEHLTPHGAGDTFLVEGHEVRVLDQIMLAEKLPAVRRCLAQLTPDQRRCIELRYGLELGFARVGEPMDRRAGAAKSVLYRALRRLAEQMAEQIPAGQR